MTEHKNVGVILLSNALDFIDSATSQLVGTPTERDLKYVILHLSAGIELLLKVRLHREHWALVFDPSKITKPKYQDRTLKSVGAEEALKRVQNICAVVIPNLQLEAIAELKATRNKLEHFGIVLTADAMKSKVSETLAFVVDFVGEELKPESAGSTEVTTMLHNIRSRLASIQEFVTSRRQQLEQQLKGVRDPILECPSCLQLYWLIRANEAACMFCGRHDANIVSAAESYLWDVATRYDLSLAAEEHPILAQCFECDAQAVVVGARLNNKRRAFCFNCRRDWDVAEFDFRWGVDNAEDGSVQ